jgi:hypothetical protein
MKLSKFDIGAEIISIITKGMYPDPKDALREYIQNGIDAKANAIKLKIRQESIVIHDNGHGMSRKALRKAIRIGVSDKNPNKDIGFMGIGIYSSFHLCGKMTIYSMSSNKIPNILTMDFGEMKSVLESQKISRQNPDFDSDELIDLQSLLEKCIELTEDSETPISEFPEQGTRIELTNIEPEFYSALSNFDEVGKYLENVIPLHFDKEKFKYADLIEKRIHDICKEKNQEFELIDLTLQVNSRIETLYRPYKDADFEKNKLPLEPVFMRIQNGDNFFGVAWGCLNSERKKLNNKETRGFILKKQGFSIGRREGMIKYFPRGSTFFDRYTGEIIIVNPKILPNASRNDIEYSPLRSIFLNVLTDIAGKFDNLANRHQEENMADEELAKLQDQLKSEIAHYNEYEENSEELIDTIVKIKKISEQLDGRINRGGFSITSVDNARDILQQVNSFEKTVQERVRYLTDIKSKKQQNKKVSAVDSKTEIAKKVNSIKLNEVSQLKNYENLNELIDDLGFNVDENLKTLMYLIDEIFIQNLSKSKSEYFELLDVLKERFENESE